MKTKFIYGAIAALFALNVSLCAFAQDEPTLFEDDEEDIVEVVSPCLSGGPGSSNCSNEGKLDFTEIGGGASCEVTCNFGYYACCGLRCTCEPDGRIY